MTGPGRLLYVTVYVADLARSRDFYERALGYRPLSADATSARYSTGHLIVHLVPAAAYGVRPPAGERDRSLALTFLVDDLAAMRGALEGRGVRVTRTLTSRAGAMADLYDPDGHWISLYEPAPAAFDWPSGAKLRELRDTTRPAADGLDGHALLYLFLFVADLGRAAGFYGGVLGLDAVEVTPCHRGVTAVPDGVVKYDVGGGLLTTHHVGDGDHAALHKVTTRAGGALALGFHTTDLPAAAAGLRRHGLSCDDRPVAPDVGATARFRDPGGHVYYLCQPARHHLDDLAALRR